MTKENPSIAAFKVWVFPSLVSLVSLLIWNDVNEIKADVKLLMAQSNVDKTRIDNIEREMFKTSSAPLVPSSQHIEYQQLVAVLPDNKLKTVKYEF
jgi:hypothetical protein